jgi:cytidine deaminase
MKLELNVRVVPREEVGGAQRELLNAAFAALDHAYAPYSGFRVAAAVRLDSGEHFVGTNQENASYPVGICAERVALSTVQSVAPGAKVERMAIAYRPASGLASIPLAPCGMCRQAMVEQHARQKAAFEVVLAAEQGDVWVIADASSLLPLAFTPSDLR